MRNVACAVTPLNEIVGSCFGNALEMREIYDFLSGKKDTVMYKELEEVVLNFGSNILSISTDERDLNKNKKKILENVENGKALQSFEKIISLGGGDVDALKTEVKAKCKIPVMADEEGFISEIDVNQLRQLAKYLNAIRAKEDDLLDFGSGVAFYKKIGDNISKGEIIADIYTNNETKIAKSVACVKELFKISDKKIKDTSRITYNT
jgi:pyrimidine-nucleoside phosphorylase